MQVRVRPFPRPGIALALFLGVILLGLLFEQSQSLYTAPIPDAARAYGDETWLMREFQTQLREGVSRDPDAPGSTLYYNNGILLNSLWLNAAIYGIPAIVFFPHWSLVSIGRTITLLLAIALLLYAYWFQRRRGIPEWLSLTSCLLLVANRSFFFATHSSRYDMLVALGALLALDFLSHVYSRLHTREALLRAEWFLLLFFPALCLAWNIHLSRMELLPYLFIVAVLARSSFSRALGLLTINVLTLSLLILPALLLIGHWGLVSANPGNSQLAETLSNVPLLHKFSLSVVRSTFAERFLGIWKEAPIALVVSLALLVIATVLLLFHRATNGKELRLLLPVLLLTLLSWAITLRFVSYYGFHILPVLVIGGAVVFDWMYGRITRIWLRRSLGVGYVTVAIVAALLSFRDSSIARERGGTIVASIQSATSQALSTIRAERRVARPTVLVGLQLQDFLQREPDIQTINWLYREYPDTPITLPQFLEQEHVTFILARKSEPIWAELATAPFPLTRVAAYRGTFGDWGYDYFGNSSPPDDTLILERIGE